MQPWALAVLLAIATAIAAVTTLARPDLRTRPDLYQRQPDADQPEDYDEESSSEREYNHQAEQVSCGQRPMVPWIQSRIINGEDQVYGEFPSFVSLINNEDNIVCGGTLISARHVLTAAHCLNGTGSAAGFHVLLGPREPHYKDYDGNVAVRELPCVAPGHQLNVGGTPDWAVLELRQAANFKRRLNVQPACLPWANSPRLRHDATHCWVLGAGVSNFAIIEGKVENFVRRKVQKFLVHQEGCAYEMNYTLHGSQVCYAPLDTERRSTTCVGDSGGPVLCRDEAPRRWTLAAITNMLWGDEFCNIQRQQVPPVYTDVASILDEMREACAWMGVP